MATSKDVLGLLGTQGANAYGLTSLDSGQLGNLYSSLQSGNRPTGINTNSMLDVAINRYLSNQPQTTPAQTQTTATQPSVNIPTRVGTNPLPSQPKPVVQQQQNWSLSDLSSLFNKQLESWWNTVKPTLPQTADSASTATDQGLSSLFPRVNWGNYQTANRGSRYFDQNTGNYTLDNTITMGT